MSGLVSRKQTSGQGVQRFYEFVRIDMDKRFWISVIRNEYAIPAGYTILPLTDELFSFIRSTDPELRDSIGLEVFFHWLDRGLYSLEDICRFIPRLLANLQEGLGEKESDSVYQRSFSSLWLALIIQNDNKKPALTRGELVSVLEALRTYFTAEQDYRGFDRTKGFAHAIAHAADLFSALASNPCMGESEHLKILECIAAKLKAIPDWIFIYGEESRLAAAVLQIFARGTLSIHQIKTWLAALSADWNNAWSDDERALAFFNGRNFLRSLHYKLLNREDVSDQEMILTMLRETLDQVNPIIMPEL
jgi:hypothetical protein